MERKNRIVINFNQKYPSNTYSFQTNLPGGVQDTLVIAPAQQQTVHGRS
jgi:hypothetical protein